MTAKFKNILLTAVMGLLLLGLSLFCWFKPASPFSESERRVLAQFPKLNLEEILSGSFMGDFEGYTQDQFPLRESFRRLKAEAEMKLFLKLDNNGLFVKDGHVSKLEYPMSEAMLDNAAKRFEHIYNSYLADSDVNIWLSVIPDKNFYLAGDMLSMDYDAFIEYIREKTPYMEYIELRHLLSADDYYYTDSHWRQECILPVVQELCSAMDAPASPSPDMAGATLDVPFKGVYVGQSALKLQPDSIKYLSNSVINRLVLTSYDTGTPVEKPIYNFEKAQGRDPYEFFLSGNDALVTIENPAAETDRELVVFRDSFGSSIAPLLAEHYAKVTLIDIRYIQSGLIGNFVEFSDQDVLFLYSTTILNNSSAFK